MKFRVVVKQLPSHLRKGRKPYFEMEAPTVQLAQKKIQSMFPWVHVIELWPLDDPKPTFKTYGEQPYISQIYIGHK